MTNRCYLSVSDYEDIYPSFSDPDFDADTQWVDHGAGCLPLIWLPMFTDEDLVSKEFTVDGETFTETAPIVHRTVGIERLLSHRIFLNELFQDNGGLDHHIDTFADYLSSVDGQFATIELQEISWLYNEGEFQPLLRECLRSMRARTPTVRESLVILSTVIDDRKFLTFQDAQAGNYEQEDMWNYFRIMGEPYIREVPWS